MEPCTYTSAHGLHGMYHLAVPDAVQESKRESGTIWDLAGQNCSESAPVLLEICNTQFAIPILIDTLENMCMMLVK